MGNLHNPREPIYQTYRNLITRSPHIIKNGQSGNGLRLRKDSDGKSYLSAKSKYAGRARVLLTLVKKTEEGYKLYSTTGCWRKKKAKTLPLLHEYKVIC